jgi:type III secretion protein D
MDRANPALESLLELRVQDGPQRGARAPLPGGAAVVIAFDAEGRASGADIVLRDAGAGAARLRVTPDTPNSMLEVLQGQVQLGERTLATGEQALWPKHVALRAGATRIAFGRACDETWSDGAVAAGANAASAPVTTGRRPLRRRAEVWLATTGACVLLACAGALWLAHAASARATVAPQALDLATALRGSEFAALELVRSADGRATLRGRLATQAERKRLEAWLASQQANPKLDLVIDETVAQNVTEVFRVNGVAVKAQAAGAGRFVAEAAESDRARLARAEEVVRRDVRGLGELSVRNNAPPATPPAPVLADDPNKRIASLVPGDTAYLVTVDGARYFVGALLPSGHRIARIVKGSVVLERDGQQSALNF